MNLTIKLYEMLTAISRWIENARVAQLVRIYGICKEEIPPIPWREREGLPSSDQWPKEGGQIDNLLMPDHSIWITGKVKAGPVRPVPAKFDEEDGSRG
jgi:hypothetical protein